MLFDGDMTADRKLNVTSYDADVSLALQEFMRTGWTTARAIAVEPYEVGPYAAKRRAALSSSFPGRTLVVPAGALKPRNGDCFYPFRPSSGFVWLTGAGTQIGPSAVLVMTPDAESPGVHNSTLYMHASAPRTESDEFYRDRTHGELWTGWLPGPAEIEAELGVTTRSLDEFDLAELAGLAGLAGFAGDVLVLRGHDPEIDAAIAGSPDDAKLAQLTDDLRLVKDDWEVAQLADAADASIRGFADVVSELAQAKATSERWIEGTFWRRARVDGNEVGYSSIAAAGSHACILHWTRDDGPVRDGDLVLLDAGVENNAYYTADVTRTFPVNGRFSPAQRKVYQLVYDAQEAAMDAVKPGAQFRDYFRAAQHVLAKGLVQWGILPEGADDLDGPTADLHRRYTLHGTGHMLGLDVHDCAQARAENYHGGPLKIGYVLTVEPGLYFQLDDLTVPSELRGIGVRIEDDVVVTADGCRNLTGALPRDPDAVEAWMAGLTQI
jgi:Xaa-Pro aminopeptidase